MKISRSYRGFVDEISSFADVRSRVDLLAGAEKRALRLYIGREGKMEEDDCLVRVAFSDDATENRAKRLSIYIYIYICIFSYLFI